MRLTKFTHPVIPGILLPLIEEHFQASRFNLVLAELVYTPRTVSIELKVQLQERKHFCGNHPGACALSGHDKAHRRTRFMEGADWVDFNDSVNDLLDRFHVDCEVFSKPRELTRRLIIRKGKMRRLCYGMEAIQGTRFNIWVHDEDGVYADYCGKEAPRSEFPSNTPGHYPALDYAVVG